MQLRQALSGGVEDTLLLQGAIFLRQALSTAKMQQS